MLIDIPLGAGSKVRTLRITGEVLRRAITDDASLTERVRAITPADIRLYSFIENGKGVIMLPEPEGDDAWVLGIISDEFDEVLDGGPIPLHDKEID
jgi:hypothetical protein